MRTLKQGHKGEDVRYLQYLIRKKLDIPISIDGSFGPGTTAMVKKAQAYMGLKPDGLVGPITQRALGLYDFRVEVYDKDKVWFAGTPYGAAVKPLYNLKAWAIKEKADKVFNLAFFNMGGVGSDEYGPIRGRTLTYLRAKGYDVGYGGTKERIHIDSKNICAGYKLAVKNGSRGWVSSIGKRCRNANGLLADGRYFHVQSVTKSTEKAIVDYMIAHYDVDLMLIQDSGGSTGEYDSKLDVLLAGEREGPNGRPVASVVCVKE